MRVLFISNLYPPHFFGGYEVACKDIANEFKKNGHSVFILTSTFGVNSGTQKNNIYRILKARINSNIHKSLIEKTISLFFNPFNYKETLRIIKRIKPDVASVWSINGISVSPIFAAQKMGIPCVVHLFDRSFSFLRKNCWKGILNYFLYNRLNFDNIVSCSESLKKDYIKKGFEGRTICVIYHGVIPEKEIFPHKGININDIKLLFVGQLWEAKGIDLAIRALPLLEKNGLNAKLTIIGDGLESYKLHLKKIAIEYDIAEKVDFVSKVPREKLKSFYRTHDILLFPTYSWYREPFGIVILEAMNQGIPVIASDSGGPKEIIIDGENGLLFEPGNVESLTSKIMLFARKPELYEINAKNAFKRIKNQFDISITSKKIIEYYENISKKA